MKELFWNGQEKMKKRIRKYKKELPSGIVIDRDGSHVVLRNTGFDGKLSPDFKTSGSK